MAFSGRLRVEQTGSFSVCNGTGVGVVAFAVAPSIDEEAAEPRAATRDAWSLPEVEVEGEA